jgi:hypothetical protein
VKEAFEPKIDAQKAQQVAEMFNDFNENEK